MYSIFQSKQNVRCSSPWILKFLHAGSINLARFTFLDPGSLFLRNKSYWIHEGPSKSVQVSSCGPFCTEHLQRNRLEIYTKNSEIIFYQRCHISGFNLNSGFFSNCFMYKSIGIYAYTFVQVNVVLFTFFRHFRLFEQQWVASLFCVFNSHNLL